MLKRTGEDEGKAGLFCLFPNSSTQYQAWLRVGAQYLLADAGWMEAWMDGRVAYSLVLENISEAVLFEMIPEG